MKLKNLTKRYSLYMVGQRLKQEKKLGVSLKKKKTLLSLQVMVRFLLVLTLGISTTSCSHLLQKAKSGSCSRLGVDLERWRINQLFACLILPTTPRTNRDKTSHIDTLQKD